MTTLLEKHQKFTLPKNDSAPPCPEGQFWVSPHQRKRITKSGKTYTEQVKGYCCCYHGPYQKIAEEENIPFDHLFFVLTVYGEARGENTASRRAIAWVIRNRFSRKSFGDSYRSIVLKPLQFSCWNKGDKNYKMLQNPGKNGNSTYEKEVDKNAWQKCKDTFKEVFYAAENENFLPGVYHYFSGKPKKHWQEKYFDLPDIPNFHFVKLDK